MKQELSFKLVHATCQIAKTYKYSPDQAYCAVESIHILRLKSSGLISEWKMYFMKR